MVVVLRVKRVEPVERANLAKLQDIMIYGLKGLSAYRGHANEFGANTKRGR